MQQLLSTDILLCEGFRLDRLGLFRLPPGGVASPVTLGSRALDLLRLLVERRGELVSKDEIMDTVWSGAVVEDNNLTVQISTLRRVLDHGRAEGSCIQTVVGRGYRFVAAVTSADDDECLNVQPINPPRTIEFEEAISATPTQPSRISAGRQSRHRGVIPIVLIVLAILGAVVGVISNSHWFNSIKPSRLSMVVLPFKSFGDEPGQQHFADSITDDVTSDLSRLPDMIVISRNTAFTYRNKSVDTKAIGRELNVRYVLEGSVQRSGNRIRINAELIDAEADTHLWVERFERDTSDLFALQNEITTRIAVALRVELAAAEAARPAEHPDALDYILRARALATRLSPAKYAEAISLLERALALDPGSVEAKSWLANVLAGRVLSNMTSSPAADLERAKGLSEQALAAAPLSAEAHSARGQVLRAQRRFAEAIPEYEMVLSLDRNFVQAYFALGQCKLLTGSIEETIPLVERAIRLSPRDGQLGVWYQTIGLVHLLQSRTGEAIVWLEKARNVIPAHSILRSDLASAYALNGEAQRAAAELAEARRLSPDDRYSSLARLRATPRNYWGVPKIRALWEATYFAGLRKAGMPEE